MTTALDNNHELVPLTTNDSDDISLDSTSNINHNKNKGDNNDHEVVPLTNDVDDISLDSTSNIHNKDANNNDTMMKETFQDTSTECAICLGLLDDGDSQIITLSCGHRWHLECIQEQLEHAQPNPRKRLLFTGCRCAKCGSFCDHDLLQHLTQQTNELRQKVDQLILDMDRKPENNDEQKELLLLEQGRRNYAFYLCHSCHEPFFGGTIDCADRVDGHGDGDTEEDRYCSACSPQMQSVTCRNPLEHRSFHIWKCRYCCQPSTYVCYGSVHFCRDCHQRNDQRVRQQRRQRRGQQSLPPLQPIPCPGGDQCCVPFPKPPGETHHKNGPTADCEQIYQCTCCESSSTLSATTMESGSRNFVVNPSGQEGLRGWFQMNRRMSWQVEYHNDATEDNNFSVPPLVDSQGQRVLSNFVSSFRPCVMGQRIPIHRLVRNPSAVRIEVSAKFLGRTDCPSVFKLDAVALDRNGRELLRQTTNTLPAPVDAWERACLVIEPPMNGLHEVCIVIQGKDTRFWQGNFGSKVAECSVRVLCPEHELPNILLPEAEGRGAQNNNVQQQQQDYQRQRQMQYNQQQHQQQRHRQGHRQQDQRPMVPMDVMYNVLVPCLLLFFFWLVSSS